MDSQSDPSRPSLDYSHADSSATARSTSPTGARAAHSHSMSVALASMDVDSAYGLGRLAAQLQQRHRRQREQQQPAAASSLRFSVVNILRPDFGRQAILARVEQPGRSPSEAAAPSGLSRSASLESLASSRSSVAGAGAASGADSPGQQQHQPHRQLPPHQPQPQQQSLWPAWIYCTRYSDRPSSGPRSRRVKRTPKVRSAPTVPDEKRPRTAFSGEQLAKLRDEFTKNKYLNEERRQKLARDLGLNEQQIKIWFQNKRAKIKKSNGNKNPLALQLMAQGLYNHSTVSVDEDTEDLSR